MTAAEAAATAIAHERAGRWSEAREAWESIPRASGAVGARARQGGLQPGQVLSHVRRGQVRATCVYEVGENGAERFIYAGHDYASASAAARAAAEDLGYACAVSYNGWVFWGVEKRASERHIGLSRS